MIRKKHILLLTFVFFHLLFCVDVLSQDLIVNGNFSLYFRCPGTYNHYNSNIKQLLPGWSTVNQSTPDFFHRCSRNSDVGVPNNFAGSTEPFEGDGYIGIILRSDPETYPYSSTYSEHITGVLELPLEAGEQYCFTMYYTHAQNSGIGTSSIGIYFSFEKPEFRDNDDFYTFQPQLILHPDSMLSMQPGWKELSSMYKAYGGERYVTIGNFQPISQNKIIKHDPTVFNDTRFFAYYYIDGISLTPAHEGNCRDENALMITGDQIDHLKSKDLKEGSLFEAGTTYTLKNVYFDFEKSILRPESHAELNTILDFLNNNSHIHILIIGHTDNIGSATYNQALSELRAKAVFEYFFKKGISLSRMKYLGMGSKVTVADNETEYGRQLNRRVEIEFYIP